MIKTWDEEWEDTNEAIRQIYAEQYPILELKNDDPNRERLMKPIRARAVALHYERINLLLRRPKIESGI